MLVRDMTSSSSEDRRIPDAEKLLIKTLVQLTNPVFVRRDSFGLLRYRMLSTLTTNVGKEMLKLPPGTRNHQGKGVPES